MTAAVEAITWTTQEAAAAFVRAGCSVLRVKADGSKAPAGRWEEAQHQAADLATVMAAFSGGHPGVGIVTGAVSGNLEMLELEGRAVEEGLHVRLAELAAASGLDELWQRVATGYREWTPGGGAHLLYRVDGTPVLGNTKLARRPSTPQELRDHQTREIARAREQHADDPAMLERRMQVIAALTPERVPQVLVETRGEGGFVVAAPSGGPVHPTGRPWVLDCGRPDSIPTVTAAEYQALHDLARALDQMPQPEPPAPRRTPPAGPAGDVERPGDRFNRLATWHDILLPHGWRPLRGHGGTTYWCRPGKAAGVSATTGRNEHDRLFVFSSSTEFEAQRPYDKLGALALLEYGGDIAAAARAIAADPRYRDDRPLTPDRFLQGAHGPPTGAPAVVPDPSPTGEVAPDPDEEAYLAAVMADEQRRDAGQSPWALQLAQEVDRQRLREEAARVLRRERADAAGEPTPLLLSDFLAVPDEDVAHRVEGLWPVGGRVVLAAQYKAGKTTLRDNLVRALVDDELFLGRFTVHPPAGRVVIIDNELDERMLRRWLRDQGVQHPERVAVLPLRGRVATFDLLDDDTRARWAAKLRAVDASVVLFDCLRPVLDALGLSEDKEAGRFLVAFDALLAEAGASEAVIVHHMGHAGERSRGDTRLRDWPDVEWQLVREKVDEDEQDSSARRFFAAYGRDVEQPEGLLEYDHASRRLTLAGGTRRDARADAGIPQVMAYLESQPGATQRGIEVALKDLLGGPKAARAALKRAVSAGLVDVVEGPRRSHLHFPSTTSAPSAPASASAHPAHSPDECASAPLGGARRTQSADGPDELDLDPAHSALTEDR